MASVRKSRLSSRCLTNILAESQAQQRTGSVPLKAIDQSPIRSQSHLLHGILERYELLDVEVWCIGKVLSGRVKINIEAGSFIETKVLYQGGAKGSLRLKSVLAHIKCGPSAHLAGASRTHHYNAELAHGWAGANDDE